MKTKLLATIIGAWLLLPLFVQAQLFNNHYLAPERNTSLISVKSTVIGEKQYATSVYSTFDANGTYDIHLIKTDNAGNVYYQKQYGLKDNNEYGNGICVSQDGGNIIVGQYKHAQFGLGLLAFKVDFDGNLQWSNWYGNTDQANANGITIERIPQSDKYFIAGSAYSPARIVGLLIDGSGNQIWSNTYTNPNVDRTNIVTDITTDNQSEGFIITGEEFMNTSNDQQRRIFTFAVDYNGNPSDPISTILFLIAMQILDHTLPTL